MADDRERTFHQTNSAYSLPNDATEHKRLDLQTEGINRLMHNQVFHAPLTAPSSILEIGCGTGSTTQYLASTFPSAHPVLGIDLSPVPSQPANSRAAFIQSDIRTCTDPRLVPASFDFVFSRMLVYGMADWPGYIAQAHTLLRSGGWLELQEVDTSAVLDRDGKAISGEWPWREEQLAALRARGVDPGIAPRLEGLLQKEGFVDVAVKTFRWMHGPSEQYPESRFLAEVFSKYTVEANFQAYKRLVGEGKTEAELEEVREEMRRDFGWAEDERFQMFYVVVGRKP